ncbi:MAG: FtsX-like permease family protein [Gammaproteobacteria bacterium]|nr:FtsX-like permease family protein [Gammaproteobacteria bacterium]
MASPGKRLLNLSAWRYAYQHPWQSWLSFLGIMLGVMMVVAIDLASNSADRAFELAINSVNGSITHQIIGGDDGVPESVYTDLRTDLGLRKSAPSITGTIQINGEAFTLLGQDSISELSLQRQRAGFESSAFMFDPALLNNTSTNPILMSQNAAADAGFALNDLMQAITGANQTGVTPNTVTLLLSNTIPSSDPIATEGMLYTDIAVAQNILQNSGFIDSIDLILEIEQIATLQDWLPIGLSLVDVETRNDTLDQMTSAFHVNLLAMSLLSLLVAALLIYNTVTLSVLRREKTLGIFRAQGVSRTQIYRLVLSEAALYGTLASALGVLLGYWLGLTLLDFVTAAIPDFNYRLNVTSFIVEPTSLILGFLLGLGITLASAAVPAWRATLAQPITLQQRAAHNYTWRHYLPILSYSGFTLMILGFVLLQTSQDSLVLGFVALTFIIFGFCFVVPMIMSVTLKILLRLFSKTLKLPARMALRNIQNGLNRTGMAVAALTVAISVTIGVGIMVDSFRNTVIIWLDQSFAGDIEISGTNLDADLQTLIETFPGISSVSATINTQIESSIGQVRLNVSDIDADERYYLKQINEQGLASFNNGEGILLSEPLAWLYEIEVGESISVFSDTGVKDFQVLGIFYDYTPSQGMIAMHYDLYQRSWNKLTPSRLTIFSDNSNPELFTDIEQMLETYEQLAIFPNQQIQNITLSIFDRTFEITGVLRILAIVIAFIGVLSALMALLLERGKEFAILRATGMTPAQIIKLIIGQTALMGFFAGLLAIPLGLIMSDVLIDVINKRSFGWSMQHFFPLSVLSDALLLAIVAALLAGIYPAFKSARISPALALREE